MPSSPWIFICPSNRGIGHALTRRLLLTTRLPILATTRHSDPSVTRASLLEGLLPPRRQSRDRANRDEMEERLSLVRCDVKDEASIQDAASRAAELFPGKTHHLHLACVIPGVLRPEKSLAQVDGEGCLESFRVNAVGPLLLAKHFTRFLPRRSTKLDPGPTPDTKTESDTEPEADSDSNSDSTSDQYKPITLPNHATWLTMSARVGSTTDNRAGGWYSYRASKAAVNSITRTLDLSLRASAGDAALAVAYHPGTVATDFSKDFWAGVPEGKLFSPEFAAEKLVGLVSGLEIGQRGRCWDWKGEEVPP